MIWDLGLFEISDYILQMLYYRFEMILDFRLETLDFIFYISDFRLEICDLRFETRDFIFETKALRFEIRDDFRFEARDLRF